MEGAFRRRKRGSPHASIAQRGRLTGPAGHVWQLRTDGDQGGLVFLGGGEPYLYAFDMPTGAELWRGATPYPTQANPMT
ncbi:MAG: PQQ-binding-like beta-propeller repeat protein [Dehalococcoidia bacterium]|nr:PQQ-binding-like beta-propeller repeat protein [Dehalococcoidia bacterium]